MSFLKYLKNVQLPGYQGFKTGVQLQEAASTSLDLKEAIASKIPAQIELIRGFRKSSGSKVVSQVTVDMIYNGMRGIKGLICETSVLDPDEGIRFRGYTIPDCQEKLPKASAGGEPLPEGLFWLLCTGDIPTKEQVASISKEWSVRSKLPDDFPSMLKAIPTNIHPMSQFSAICTLLNRESKFAKGYEKGIRKQVYWEYVYEDAMDLIAKLPVISAIIYLRSFRNKNDFPIQAGSKDWSLNFAELIGYSQPEFTELMRLYLTIHSDHEGGNVSAHTTHLVGSALSDPYLAFAAGMNGLAGPLHGRANQEVLEWLMIAVKELGGSPSDEKLKEFVLNTLKGGKVIPGYGHAVLRKTDPRFVCQADFAKRRIKNDPLIDLTAAAFRVIPPVLTNLGKVKNPWPNVDAHSGVLLYHFGMKEMSFYTVLFGMSRALGVLASLIWDRAVGLPIERPKSFSTEALMKLAK